MDPADASLLGALRQEAGALGQLAAIDLHAAVPTCPGWDVAALVSHTGQVHRWATAVIRAGGDRVGSSSAIGVPTDESNLLAWFAAGAGALATTFDATSPDADAWTFSRTGARSVRWWLRRQAVETAVHRVDVALALGRPVTSLSTDLAVAGLREYLTEILPGAAARATGSGLTGTLHLHATDSDAEWWVDLDADPVVAVAAHTKADTVLRGPTTHLLLWLWNRQPTYRDDLEVLGPDAVLRSWSHLRH